MYTVVIAAQNGHDKCVALILEHGANKKLEVNHKTAALTFANQSGYDKCAVLLLQHGADLNPMDDKNIIL